MKPIKGLKFPARLLFLAWTLSSACWAAPPSYDHQILWMDSEKNTQVMFVPEKILNETAMPALPLSESDRSHFEGVLQREESIEEYRKRTGRQDEPLCPHGHVETSTNAPGLKELIGEEPLTLLATVDDVVPGYSFWQVSAVNMVYLRPEVPLRGSLTATDIGGLLAYAEPWGSIVVRGRQTCWQPPPGVYRARKGDRVLVIGRQFGPNPIVLGQSHVFPVVNGLVQYRLYPDVKDFKSISLDDLRISSGGHP